MIHAVDIQTPQPITGGAIRSAGKRALIAGAFIGLGLDFAELLAAKTVNLVLAARRREPMEKLATELRAKYGVDVLVEPIDLAAPGAATRLKTTLDEKAVRSTSWSTMPEMVYMANSWRRRSSAPPT